MLSTAAPFGHIVAVVVIALSLWAAAATAGRPCGRGVIDDWYDNGKFDRSWNCACVLDSLAMLPQHGRFLAARKAMERHVRTQCADSRDVSKELPEPLGHGRASGEYSSQGADADPTADATSASSDDTGEPIVTLSFQSQPGDIDKGIGVSDDLVPWLEVIAGMIIGGLIIVIGAASLRRYQLRP
jgi:hypothetical protein